jgi:hypothetical protein
MPLIIALASPKGILVLYSKATRYSVCKEEHIRADHSKLISKLNCAAGRARHFFINLNAELTQYWEEEPARGSGLAGVRQLRGPAD